MALAHDYRYMREGRGWMCVPAVEIGIRLPNGLLSLARLVFV